jgi:hypothetical protein
MPAMKRLGAPDAGNPHVRCDEGRGEIPAYSIVSVPSRYLVCGVCAFA